MYMENSDSKLNFTIIPSTLNLSGGSSMLQFIWAQLQTWNAIHMWPRNNIIRTALISWTRPDRANLKYGKDGASRLYVLDFESVPLALLCAFQQRPVYATRWLKSRTCGAAPPRNSADRTGFCSRRILVPAAWEIWLTRLLRSTVPYVFDFGRIQPNTCCQTGIQCRFRNTTTSCNTIKEKKNGNWLQLKRIRTVNPTMVIAIMKDFQEKA